MLVVRRQKVTYKQGLIISHCAVSSQVQRSSWYDKRSSSHTTQNVFSISYLTHISIQQILIVFQVQKLLRSLGTWQWSLESMYVVYISGLLPHSSFPFTYFLEVNDKKNYFLSLTGETGCSDEEDWMSWCVTGKSKSNQEEEEGEMSKKYK